MSEKIILEMRHIYKKFARVIANNDVNIEVRAGEVHALLGENGAGKSTLMNQLCGLYKPTEGHIIVEGKEVHFNSARDAMAIGIGMVHQHFMLIPPMTVTENCLIGAKDAGGMKIDYKKASKKIADLAEKYNLQIDPNEKIENLAVGERQRVEIIKALYRGAKILILDEPTSVLTPQETEELFNMIRSLTTKGFTVLFISHKLNEIKEICDRVTILRRGKTEGTYNVKDCSVNDLAKLMVGRDVDFSITKKEVKSKGTVIDVKNLTLPRDEKTNLLTDISFKVNGGEIFGIAGVDGNGQNELVECLTGMKKTIKGSVLFEGKDLLKMNTRSIMKSGVSHIPSDRNKTGLIGNMPLSENFILQDYYKDKFGKLGLLNNNAVDKYSDDLIVRFGVKTPSRFELANNLSGGNQQKVIVAREIARDPKFLIAMHPTRGLDVGAIEYIHKEIVNKRDEGIGVLLVSTELDEIMKLSDRIGVMFEGKLMGIVNAHETNIEEIGLMMGGMKLEDVRKK